MKAGGKMVVYIILIGLALLTVSRLAGSPKKIDVSEIESIEKPSNINELKVEKEGNTRKVVITVEDGNIENSKKQAEELLDSIEREEGTVFIFEIVDKDKKVIATGLSLIGSSKIDWN